MGKKRTVADQYSKVNTSGVQAGGVKRIYDTNKAISNMIDDHETELQKAQFREWNGVYWYDNDVTGFRRALTETMKPLAKYAYDAGRFVSSAGRALSEPREGIGLLRSIDFAKWAFFLDEINPTEHSLLENFGYDRPDAFVET